MLVAAQLGWRAGGGFIYAWFCLAGFGAVGMNHHSGFKPTEMWLRFYGYEDEGFIGLYMEVLCGILTCNAAGLLEQKFNH